MTVQAASSRHPPAACTLHEAAAALGISLNTLRRRIRAGQVRAERVERPQGHVWRVYVDDRQHAEHRAAQEAPGTVQQPPMAPVDVLRAEAMATYTRSLLEPLVARLAEQEAIIRDQAEELGRLRQRVATLERPADPDPTPAPEPSPPTPAGKPWWRRWLAIAGSGLLLAVVASSCQVSGSTKHAGLCTAARRVVDGAATQTNLTLINWIATLDVVGVVEKTC